MTHQQKRLADLGIKKPGESSGKYAIDPADVEAAPLGGGFSRAAFDALDPRLEVDVELYSLSADDPIPFITVPLDIRPFLDRLPIELLPYIDTDGEHFFKDAVELGLLKGHGSRVNVDLWNRGPELSAYFDARNEAHLFDPVIDTAILKSPEARREAIASTKAEMEKLEAKMMELEQEELTAFTIKLFPEAREIEIYDNAEDDEEPQFRVCTVRGPNNTVLWDVNGYGMNDHSLDADYDEIVDDLWGYSEPLGKYDLDNMHHSAASGAQEWWGIRV